MDATALRAMQAPLKERYKGDPKSAYITLKAKGTLDDAHIACKVETGRALAVAGLHPATGGSGLELCSGDMLLEALTLGVAKDVPVGFAAIRLSFEVETDAPQDKLDQLLKLTERYCVVYQTLRSGPPIEVKLNRA
jgi:OsmC-like protein